MPYLFTAPPTVKAIGLHAHIDNTMYQVCQDTGRAQALTREGREADDVPPGPLSDPVDEEGRDHVPGAMSESSLNECAKMACPLGLLLLLFVFIAFMEPPCQHYREALLAKTAMGEIRAAPVFKLDRNGRWELVPVGPVVVGANHRRIPPEAFAIDRHNSKNNIEIPNAPFTSEPIYMPKVYQEVELLNGYAPVCYHSVHSDVCRPFAVPCPVEGRESRREEHASFLDRYESCFDTERAEIEVRAMKRYDCLYRVHLVDDTSECERLLHHQ